MFGPPQCPHAIRKDIFIQGGHKPGKPGILRDFSEHGKLEDFSRNLQPQGKW